MSRGSRIRILPRPPQGENGGAGENVTASPQTLADLSPAWERDVAAFGPWEQRGGEWLSIRDTADPLFLIPACSSSQDALLELGRQGRAHPWSWVVAGVQTSGRGRMRRAWQSPAGNLFASVLWPNLNEPWRDLASLIAGWSFCLALEEALGTATRIKWPNDLFLGPGKVAGILVEERGDLTLVGCGLNLAVLPDPAAMRIEGAAPGVVLDAPESGPGPLSAWASLAPRVRATAEAVTSETTPRAFLDQVQSRLLYMGEPVRVREAGGVLSGVVRGLADDGGLILAGEGGQQVLYSGSIIQL